MRFATRTLSSSVVKVVAAFVPLVGCADEHHAVVSNPPNYPPGCEQPGCVPALIDGGAGPDGAGPDGAGPDGAVRDATTRDATSGDAVAPDLTCPSSEPRGGDACRVPRSEFCEYGPETPCGFSARSWNCANGRWQQSVSSCNPPYVPCPDAAPAEGELCAQGRGPASCGYGECAGGDAGVAVTYLCTAGAWVVNQRCGNTTCPSTRPGHGTPCDYVGDGCGYDACGPDFSTTARCVDGAWQLSIVSCNPPPPPLCPDPQPVQGADCQHSTGASCYVIVGGGGTVLADCVNGKWQVHWPDAGR